MNPLERVHARPLPGFVSSRPALSPGFFVSEQHRSTHMSLPPVPLSSFHRLWNLASGIRPFSTPEGQAFAQIGAGLDAARSLPLHSSAFRDHLLDLHLSRESYPPSSYALRRVIRDLEGQARNEASHEGPTPVHHRIAPAGHPFRQTSGQLPLPAPATPAPSPEPFAELQSLLRLNPQNFQKIRDWLLTAARILRALLDPQAAPFAPIPTPNARSSKMPTTTASSPMTTSPTSRPVFRMLSPASLPEPDSRSANPAAIPSTSPSAPP